MDEPRFNGYLHMRDTARRLRREATPAEQTLWGLLRGRQCDGYRFLRQRPLGQYVVDFYCPALHLAVEVDGGVHEREEIWQEDVLGIEPTLLYQGHSVFTPVAGSSDWAPSGYGSARGL